MPYTMLFDRAARVLLVRFGRLLSDDALLKLYEDAGKFIAAEGICPSIVDLTAVDEATIASDLIAQLGSQPPVMKGAKRVVVAPGTLVFGLVRKFSAHQAGTGQTPVIVRTFEEALAELGLERPDFQPLETQAPFREN